MILNEHTVLHCYYLILLLFLSNTGKKIPIYGKRLLSNVCYKISIHVLVAIVWVAYSEFVLMLGKSMITDLIRRAKEYIYQSFSMKIVHLKVFRIIRFDLPCHLEF